MHVHILILSVDGEDEKTPVSTALVLFTIGGTVQVGERVAV